MKTLLYLMICVPLFVHAQSEKGIHFENSLSWEQIKAKAKSEKKYIFVDAYTTWCGPCKMMDRDVYPNDTVGRVVNEKFISVKVQMDSTGKDNAAVKKWYMDARYLEKQYKVTGFPSFLFFTPEGLLIYKGLGYTPVPEFIGMVTKATDPGNIKFYSFLNDYNEGRKDYTKMHDLAMFVKNILGNDELATQIAQDFIDNTDKKKLLNHKNILFVKDIAQNKKLANELFAEYKETYLNKLSDKELLSDVNFSLFNQFNRLITSNDKIFLLSYRKPGMVDSAGDFKGLAENIVQSVIRREEYESRLFAGGKPVYKKPNWAKINADVMRKYPAVLNPDDLMLNAQLGYYQKIKDCANWAFYKDKKITKLYSSSKVPSGSLDHGLLMQLNDGGAWIAFLDCNDDKALTLALTWIDLGIKLYAANPNIAFLDTRANVLYKLGRVKEAILQEEQAIEIGVALIKEGVDVQSSISDYTEVVKKMKKGEPTYIDQAKWDDKTLRRIRKGSMR